LATETRLSVYFFCRKQQGKRFF